MFRIFLSLFVLTVPLICRAAETEMDPSNLASSAKMVLSKYCGECHTATGDGGIDYITDLARLVELEKVVPGKGEQSRLLQRMLEVNPDSKMPPPYASEPEISPNDLKIIKDWIEAGAPIEPLTTAQTESERGKITVKAEYSAVHQYLKRLPEGERKFQRFFTLTNLYNRPQREISAAQLRSVRAAVSKVLNSLSWKPDMVLPKPIDSSESILVFDIRDMDWDAGHSATQIEFWQYLIEGYPYGISYETSEDNELRELSAAVYTMTGNQVPMIRADWFVSTASRPPYYHVLLYDLVLPNVAKRARVNVDDPEGGKFTEFQMTAKDLESFLRVDVDANVARGRAARSAFAKSGVSSGSRLLERHSALFGAYWMSYDFTRQNIDQDVLRKPFGRKGTSRLPNAEDREFQHDGGEIIFNLPNGLQGYLLVNAKGERLAFGPPALVSDGSRALGNAQIVNGVSCMYCHSQGMIHGGFTDEVRFSLAGMSVEERALAKRLYLAPADFNALIAKDEERFLRAVSACEKDYYLPQEYEAGFPEPIKAVAQRFVTGDLGLVEVAAELNVEPEVLKAQIEASDALRRRLGLAGVAGGGKIKRAAWENGAAISTYQATALELRLGNPVTSRVSK